MSESTTFDFNAFIKESKETLLNPKTYFSSMKIAGGLIEPLIKVVIYGAVAGIFAFLWSVLGVGAVNAGMLGGAIGAMALIWYIVGAIIGLFIGAVILMIISSICKGSTDFEANARVTASMMVVMPISAALGFASGINFYFGMIISLCINLYALFIMYNGLVEALKAKPETSKIVMYVLAALLVLFTLVGLGTRNKVNKYLDSNDFKDLQEMVDENSKD